MRGVRLVGDDGRETNLVAGVSRSQLGLGLADRTDSSTSWRQQLAAVKSSKKTSGHRDVTCNYGDIPGGTCTETEGHLDGGTREA
jgi:hypothetical protein